MSSNKSFSESPLGFVQYKYSKGLVFSQISENWLYVRLRTKWSFWDSREGSRDSLNADLFLISSSSPARFLAFKSMEQEFRILQVILLNSILRASGRQHDTFIRIGKGCHLWRDEFKKVPMGLASKSRAGFQAPPNLPLEIVFRYELHPHTNNSVGISWLHYLQSVKNDLAWPIHVFC